MKKLLMIVMTVMTLGLASVSSHAEDTLTLEWIDLIPESERNQLILMVCPLSITLVVPWNNLWSAV